MVILQLVIAEIRPSAETEAAVTSKQILNAEIYLYNACTYSTQRNSNVSKIVSAV
jgi:hypothetical protein